MQTPCDVLSSPAARANAQGHLLLVGVGGSGKQSLARLAAFAAGCAVFEIQLKRGYGRAAFQEDLKALYTLLGQDNQKARPHARLPTCRTLRLGMPPLASDARVYNSVTGLVCLLAA